MTQEFIRSVLMWCTIIDFTILLIWFLAFTFAGEKIYRLHGRWFNLSREQFDAIHYAGLAVFKIGVLLFNLVPLVAICILG